MEEFKFVIKCFLFTGFIVFVSQYKINEETLETKAQYFLTKSSSSKNLRQAASGAVLFIRNTASDGINYLNTKMAPDKSSSEFSDKPEHDLISKAKK